MNKQLIILLVIIILVLGAGSVYLAYGLWQKPLVANQPIINSVLNLNNQNTNNQTAYIPPPAGAFDYYYNLALSERNREECNKIPDASQKDICLTKVDDLMKQTAQTEPECLGLSLDADKLICLENLALKNNKIDCCNSLVQDLKAQCQGVFITEQSSKGDSSYCNLRQTEEAKQNCLNSALLFQALKQGNSTICAQITDDKMKEGCLAELK